jgi:hypothetical protein
VIRTDMNDGEGAERLILDIERYRAITDTNPLSVVHSVSWISCMQFSQTLAF